MITLGMLVWFAAATVAHDLLLFPLYTAADRFLVRSLASRRAVNYVRVPALASGLTFLLFLPGIIRQGADTHLAATGLDQQPFLTRWLALCTAFFVVSALTLAVRTPTARRKARARTNQRR
ncbi:hypothetical protein [Pseudonocardia acaciae]|uniref:hypothetical protein n=1 Tax=Pseudonocardia acaciae TaxID=551276 RepID=UPI000687D154|nr:hypothetical protein [Pseudonocardia acaciae]